MCRYARGRQLVNRTVQDYTGIPGVGQLPSGKVKPPCRTVVLYRYTRGRAAVEQNSTGLYRCTRVVVQLPRITVQGCTDIPVVGQLRSRTVQSCAAIPGMGQPPSRTVQCCEGIPGVGQLSSRTVQGCTGIP